MVSSIQFFREKTHIDLVGGILGLDLNNLEIICYHIRSDLLFLFTLELGL
jgi:hypothetical protein